MEVDLSTSPIHQCSKCGRWWTKKRCREHPDECMRDVRSCPECEDEDYTDISKRYWIYLDPFESMVRTLQQENKQ